MISKFQRALCLSSGTVCRNDDRVKPVPMTCPALLSHPCLYKLTHTHLPAYLHMQPMVLHIDSYLKRILKLLASLILSFLLL